MVYYKPGIEKEADGDLNSEAIIIGRNIRRLRIKRGISAKDLAEQAGVKRSTISNYENARSVPRPETMKKLAEILGTSVESLRGLRTRTLRSSGSSYMDGRIPYFGDISYCISPDMMPDAVFPKLNEYDDSKSFMVKINSDDFEDLNIYEGSLVLFGSEAELAPNKILALNIDGNAYLSRVEEVGDEDMKLRIYEEDGKSYIKAVPIENDIILGIAVMYTALI